MIFHTLYLMIPLLERHFCLSWHGFVTESIDTRGTKLQSGGQCIYKTSYIFIWLSGSRVSKWLSSGFPPSPSWKGDLVIDIRVPVSHWISPGVCGGSLGGAFSSLRATSQQRSSMSCHSLPFPRSPRFACD